MRLVLAIGLLVLSMIGLCVGVSATSNPVMERIMDRVLCRADEDITEELGAWTTEGQETDFLCIDEQGNRREVTLPAFLLMVAMFVVPFLLGLFLLMQSGRSMVNNRMAKALENIQAYGMTINPDSANPVHLDGSVFRQAGVGGSPVVGSREVSADLASRLAQLQDARDKGLITAAEYDRMRQGIIEKFDD